MFDDQGLKLVRLEIDQQGPGNSTSHAKAVVRLDGKEFPSLPPEPSIK
ncbi:MAG: hypothetical protein JJE04_22075 [Acidobacteriia bacterium]|nr:hypothetical protein [Terriglobia bacterium]